MILFISNFSYKQTIIDDYFNLKIRSAIFCFHRTHNKISFIATFMSIIELMEIMDTFFSDCSHCLKFISLNQFLIYYQDCLYVQPTIQVCLWICFYRWRGDSLCNKLCCLPSKKEKTTLHIIFRFPGWAKQSR